MGLEEAATFLVRRRRVPCKFYGSLHQKLYLILARNFTITHIAAVH